MTYNREYNRRICFQFVNVIGNLPIVRIAVR